jgi:hypothetical protein
MADPITLIGLVASVIQLVDTMTDVCSYLDDVKKAPKERQELATEIAHFEPLVKELEQLHARGPIHPTSANDPRVIHMQALQTVLGDCKTRLDVLIKALKPAGTWFGRIWKRLTWTKRKTELKDMLTTIGRFKSLLDSWLHLDVW